jgi:hypothetical protein
MEPNRNQGKSDRSESYRRTRRDLRTRVLWNAKVAFEELTKSFVEHGVPSQVAERLLRSAYVRETAKKVRSGWGQKPNVSQISVKTGLDRHLVKEILMNERKALHVPEGRRDPISRVVDGWMTDPRYSTRSGPRDLPMGDKDSQGPSMFRLIEQFAPGISVRLVVDELLRVNFVTSLPNRKLRWKGGKPVDQLFVPMTEYEPVSARFRSALGALLSANLGQNRTLWRKVESRTVHLSDAPLLRRILRERADQMFSWLTDELSSSRWRCVERGEPGVQLGMLGLTFEETIFRGKKNDQNPTRRRRKRS